MRRLGELGCSGKEARERLVRLLKMGLADTEAPLSDGQRKFIQDMKDGLANNPNFEPSYGQLTKAQDLYDKYVL